jgi:hypothetical protein
MEINQDKLKKACDLFTSFQEKEEHHRKKWQRARKPETSDHHYDKMRYYGDTYMRRVNLIFKLKYPKEPFESKPWVAERDWEIKKAIKEERRQKFLSRHLYSPWFMQTSFRSDYGSFSCDKCGSSFYHSPSEITLAAEMKYKCCCGHCTNEIIKRDWDETPYH